MSSPGHFRGAASAFLDFVADDRLLAMWWLIALRGLRRGEAAGVRWVDVDLDQKIIMIEQQRLAYATPSPSAHPRPPPAAAPSPSTASQCAC